MGQRCAGSSRRRDPNGNGNGDASHNDNESNDDTSSHDSHDHRKHHSRHHSRHASHQQGDGMNVAAAAAGGASTPATATATASSLGEGGRRNGHERQSSGAAGGGRRDAVPSGMRTTTIPGEWGRMDTNALELQDDGPSEPGMYAAEETRRNTPLYAACCMEDGLTPLANGPYMRVHRYNGRRV
jgi:hypothetical protein